MAVPDRPLVLVHGYSAAGAAFDVWKARLVAAGYRPGDVHVCSYRSLTNELSIDDVAQGFERALRVQTGLDQDQPFDALVHSTGMLVLRAWLCGSERRRRRLKHLVGLAPATFGSPLAHKGRGWLGAVFRGERTFGPDFLEAGDRILDGLELASRFSWDLALRDMFADVPTFNAGEGTPFVFVFCGTSGYPFPLSAISQPGTDGAVRLAGAALDPRMIRLDLTGTGEAAPGGRRIRTVRPPQRDAPVLFVADRDHGSILSDPPDTLVSQVLDALQIDTVAGHAAFHATGRASRRGRRRGEPQRRWQQLLVRVVDELDHPVPDYFLDFIVKRKGARKWSQLTDYVMKVHPYAADRSLRCFHVDVDSFDRDRYEPDRDLLGLRLIADSGTPWVAYRGHSDGSVRMYAAEQRAAPHGRWSGVIDLSALQDIDFFHPWTTTLLEIRLDREPQPPQGRNEVLWFPETAEGRQAAAVEAIRSRRLTDDQAARLENLHQELVAQDDDEAAPPA